MEWDIAYTSNLRTVMDANGVVSHAEGQLSDKMFNSAWYEITELGGLDFEFEYQFHRVTVKKNVYETKIHRFKYINSEIIIDKDIFKDKWSYVFQQSFRTISELYIRIPMFGISIVDSDLNFLKPREDYDNAKPLVLTFYDRLRKSIFPSNGGWDRMAPLTHLQRDTFMTGYVTYLLQETYLYLEFVRDKVDELVENGWRLMTPDNEADLVEMIEIYLVNEEMFQNRGEYIYLMKGKDCMGLNINVDSQRPIYFANTLFNVDRLVSV